MSDDTNIQVSFSANVKGLLEGLKGAQDATSAACEGMKGNLGDMIESFEKFGLASLAIGAVGLAMEGLKEGFEWVTEAVEKTNADTDAVLINAGVISPEESREALAKDAASRFDGLSGPPPEPPEEPGGEGLEADPAEKIDNRGAEGSESGANSGDAAWPEAQGAGQRCR